MCHWPSNPPKQNVSSPTLSKVLFRSPALVSKMALAHPDAVVQTSDTDFCDEVAGKVSCWWLLHVDSVCVSALNSEPSCTSSVFVSFVLPFCPADVLSLPHLVLTPTVPPNCQFLMTFPHPGEISSWKHFDISSEPVLLCSIS